MTDHSDPPRRRCRPCMASRKRFSQSGSTIPTQMQKTDLFCEVKSPVNSFTVVIEDDGRVAYAYLLNGQKEIVGDLWLYNRCPAPDLPEWNNPENAPFANPIQFASQTEGPDLPESTSDFSVTWSGMSDAAEADVFLKGQWIGKLKDGVKPGWGRYARIDGPLALARGPEMPG